MGCCLTTPTAGAGDESKTNSKPPVTVTGGFEEEETIVKQVLSETPITSKKPPPILIKQEEEKVEEELNKKPVVVVEEENKAVSEEVSYSSYSASFSAATTTTTTIGVEIDEDGEVNKPMKPKLVTSSTRKVRGTGHSPHTPQPSARRTTAQRHRNVVGQSNVVRRESLPASRRVLRSPTIREETKQPGQVRRTNSVTNSGNRKPIVKVTENKVNVKNKNTTDDDDDADIMPMPVPVQETAESLENPLVSLECFIFL